MSLMSLVTKEAEKVDSNIRRQQELQEIKTKLHQQVINKIEVETLIKFDSDMARRQVANQVTMIVSENSFPLTTSEKQQLVKEVVDETFGLGPLEPLLADSSIDEILVNGPYTVFIERHGKLESSSVRFKDASHLRHIINRIVAKIGRRIDEASPMVDARLEDGSRVNAIIPPLALDGATLSIRRFKKIPMNAKNFLDIGTISPELLVLLQLAVRAKMNIVVSGGTGAGKTTFMNVISAFIPENERIITIEDAAELQLQQPHVVRLETRPANMEGKGEVSQRDLFRNSLRMRPDRIIVGEVRGKEALDMLQAMNTGHDGSITTVHSNSPRDALGRIETMVLMSTTNMDQIAIRRQMASALNLVLQVRRYSDGVRRLESMSEITGMEHEIITIQEIGGFVQKGMSADGKCIGEFVLHNVKPKFLQRAKELGISFTGIANEFSKGSGLWEAGNERK